MSEPFWVRFRPKLVEALHTYTREEFIGDLTAGVTVGLVALPLAMAFGIASGVTPQAGLYTAIVGGFLAALLGGSRLQVSPSLSSSPASSRRTACRACSW